MTPARFPLFASTARLACAAVLFASGCAMTEQNLSEEIDTAAADGPTYTVELRPAKGSPERIERPIDGVTFVQDALNESNAFDQFDREKIHIMRTSQGPRLPHKLDVKIDRSKEMVAHTHNYAVHPGDRIVIEEDTSTIVDDLLRNYGGALLGGRKKSTR